MLSFKNFWKRNRSSGCKGWLQRILGLENPGDGFNMGKEC